MRQLCVIMMLLELSCNRAGSRRIDEEENEVKATRRADGELVVTVCARSIDGRDLALEVGRLAGVAIASGPTTAEVSICIDQLPWRRALERIAAEMFCRLISDQKGGLRIERHACNPPLVFEEVSVPVALKLMAGQLGRKLLCSRRLTGTLTGIYKVDSNEEVRRVLEAVASERGLSVKWPDLCSDAPIIVSVE